MLYITPNKQYNTSTFNLISLLIQKFQRSPQKLQKRKTAKPSMNGLNPVETICSGAQQQHLTAMVWWYGPNLSPFETTLPTNIQVTMIHFSISELMAMTFQQESGLKLVCNSYYIFVTSRVLAQKKQLRRQELQSAAKCVNSQWKGTKM